MTSQPLRTARKANGKTLPEMASLIPYDKGNLSKVERGQIGSDRVVEWLAMRYEELLDLPPKSLVEQCRNGNGETPENTDVTSWNHLLKAAA